MKQRKTIKLSAIALVGALALAGCSGTSNEAPAGDASGELVFWSGIGGMADVTQAFNDSQDKIQVKFEEMPNGESGGYATLASAIAAGTGPDVAGIEYTWLPGFVSEGSLKPLDKLVADDVVANYSDAALSQVTFGDEVFGLPYDSAPMIMWYRQDMLEASGVNDIPETWEEFRTAGEALKKVYPDAHLASFNPNEPSLTAALAWQAGSHWFDTEGDSWVIGIDDADSLKVGEFWQGLIDDGIVKVQNAFSDEWTADIANGNAAGVLGASWGAGGIMSRGEANGQEGAWVAAVPPNWGTPANALYGGTAWTVTENTDSPEAAAVFAEYLATDPEAIKARGAVGSAYLAYPGLTPVAAEQFNTAYFGNDIYAVFDDAFAQVTLDWSWGPNFAVTNTALNDAYGNLTVGGTIADALRSAQETTVDQLGQTGLSIK